MEAANMFPDKVEELQRLEEQIKGGTTAGWSHAGSNGDFIPTIDTIDTVCDIFNLISKCYESNGLWIYTCVSCNL